MAENLIEKYGRLKAHQIVANFYDSVLSSPQLSPYFDGIDIQGLVNHQTAFLQAVMGGPAAQTHGEIAEAHRGIGVTEDDFAEMIRLLVGSLERHEVEPVDVETIERRYRRYQQAVVGGGA